MRWIPLESNPDVLNSFLPLLGAKEPLRAQFVDIWSTDDENLGFFPRPCAAVIVLYPLTDVAETANKAESAAIATGERPNPLARYDPTVTDYTAVIDATDGNGVPPLFFMKQTIGNACGTVAMLHALVNAPRALVPLTTDGAAARLLRAVAEQNAASPAIRGKVLEQQSAIADAAETSALAGNTVAPSAEDDIDTHFICLVEHGGRLVELDGRKDTPVDHGTLAGYGGDLLAGACARVRELIARDPSQTMFTVVALCALSSEQE